MPINYFVGWSKEDLEKALRLTQEALAAGKRLIQWGAGDSSGISKIDGPPEVVYERIYFALSQLDPDNYPTTNQRVRRTTPRYIFGS